MVGNSTKLSFAERLTWLEITVERREPGSPKIQRVAQHLLPDRMHYEKHYMPMKLMSFDHIHYDNMEVLKKLFVADLFTNNKLFRNYSDQGFTNMDEMMCWTLFVDDYALLHVLEHAKLHDPGSMNVKVEQLILVIQDVVLLENQLSFLLLKLLWRDTDEWMLIRTMEEFLSCHH
ncbi:hypothetical protein GmHk_10G028433 [Glycine max]|uniref:Uncharacterized protein n=1 Tax=Glycine soja TaxID=3848 RepID=A0A0B2SLN5_GLYSO|nr:hypothetical protein JHK87_027504 [Glycine soja]KAH1228448.1 hypothetical protein GmHk_10G028433 [Glycine max]KHN47601.1 hypothetical protein glysoja_049920 [Glycine soja]